MPRVKPKRPKIYNRKSWRARPGGGFKYRGDLAKVYSKVTCHHDNGEISPNATFEEALRIIKSHQDFHQLTKGWQDIGYHFIITPSGEIVTGRPLELKGAHVGPANHGNVGVLVMGQLHLVRPTDAQLAAFKHLYAWLCWRLDLDTNCLKGHNFYVNTQCPGSLEDDIPDVIAYAKQALRGEEPSSQPLVPTFTLDGKLIGEMTIIDNEAHLPLRQLAELFGFSINYKHEFKRADLTSGA